MPTVNTQLAPGKVKVSRVRAGVLRKPDDASEPARVVAHVEGQAGERTLSVFGEAEVRSPLDDYHLGDEAWDVVESLLAKVVGLELRVGERSDVDTAFRTVLSELTREAEARAASVEAAPVPVRTVLRRRVRRTARITLNAIRGQRVQLDPERRPATLVGVAAVRAALLGLVAAAVEGVGNPGSTAVDWRGRRRARWYLGDLDRFYEENLARLERYTCEPAPPPPSIGGSPANTYPDVKYIGRLPKDGTKGHLLEREALRYGLNSLRFPNGTFLVSDEEGHKLNFKWGRSPIASGVSLSICSYKEATRRLLGRVGVPVPHGRVFSAGETDQALDYADRIGYPVVCKPVAGLRGIGVVSNIRSRDELVQALDLYSRSELGADDFVIEQHVTGSDYRIVVINGEVVAAVVREPASVVGDGVHTVVDLVEYKNRIRALNPHLRSRPIQFSDAMRYQLSQAGLTLASIPEPGQRVVVANSANLSQGGDSFEVAHELHPSIREAAVRAVEAVPGLGFCGLDMLIEDHRKPIDEQSATVIELNAHAAIGSAQYPMWGTPTPVARLFFEACADAYGFKLPETQAEEMCLKVVAHGKVVGVNYRRWFKRRADAFGVSGWIQNTGRKEVTAVVDGPADAVSALAYIAIQGPRNAIPTSVTTTHEPRFDGADFSIIR